MIASGSGARFGVQLLAGADGARIGGAADGAGNVIADHEIGVESSGPVDGPVVQGNLIGLAPDGTTLLDSGTGIRIGEDTTGAQIGGTDDGAGNTVASEGSTGPGIGGRGGR